MKLNTTPGATSYAATQELLSPPSRLNFCISTNSNLHMDTSFETVISEPGVYKLLR
jgi:hypothetical protein